MLMNIFYMLFKSNAKETKEGIKDLDKATKELDKTFDDANEKAESLGRSFVKLVESGAAMAGAYSAYSFFKAGAIQATEYNKQLHITSTLTREHAGQLKALAQLSSQFGGDRQQALNNLSDMARFSQLRLGKDYDPMKHLINLRKQYQMLQGNPQAQANLLYGPGAPFQEQGLQMAIMASDDEFKKQMSTPGFQGALSLTNEQAKKAFDVMSSNEDLKGSVDELNTTISDTLSGYIKQLIEALSALTHKLGGTSVGALGGAALGIGGMALFKGLQWGTIAKILLGRIAPTAAASAVTAEVAAASGIGAGTALAGGAAAGAAASTLPALALAAGSTGIGGLAGYGVVSLFSDKVEGLMVKYLTRGLKNPSPKAPVTSSLTSGGDVDAMKFWMQQGYTKEQAAGIVANMIRESNGDPNARGDGGKAHGLFQWHPDRRAAILKGTGIDVSSASKEDQLKAAAWEMQHEKIFNDEYFRKLKGADAAGAYFSSAFERPADKMGEALRRGQMALGIADKTPAYTGGVNIGEINIEVPNGNAQDIARQIKSAVIGECQVIQSKVDNGRLG